jgi:hypothetical protein
MITLPSRSIAIAEGYWSCVRVAGAPVARDLIDGTRRLRGYRTAHRDLRIVFAVSAMNGFPLDPRNGERIRKRCS